MPQTLNASILPLPAVDGAAEALAPDLQAPVGSIGLCLSGGGSRALTCAMGQLRALHHLGLIDRVFAISSVSGGTWANSCYTYLPASITDEDFLGVPVLDPSKLVVFGQGPNALEHLSPNNLGRVPGGLGYLRDFGEIWKLWHEWGYPTTELWQGLIGHGVLRHFGLWQPDPAASHFDTHYFSWNQAYIESGTLRRNPGLRASDFYLVQRRRPFPVFNTALFSDSTSSADLLPFEANFMLGVRQAWPTPGPQATIGGGLLESLAMNGQFQKDVDTQVVSVATPSRRYTLADVVGSSSAAFAQVLEETYPELKGLVPVYDYFPIQNRAKVGTAARSFADGGSLENLGLNALLARGVSRIVVGINTDEGLGMDDGQIVVSSDLPPLFGLQPYAKGKGYVPYSRDPGQGANRLFRHNQVFPTAAFATLQNALWQARQRGGPVIVAQRLNVLPNPWFNIPGDSSVEILWLYNDFVPAFWNKLHATVRLAIDAAGKLQFPLYNTFDMLELDAVAVNALAHLWTWNLAAPGNADVVRDFFDKGV